MDTDKIERAAVRAVEKYIDKCPRLVSYIDSNDKTPIWDGFAYVYKSEGHKNENFFARIPLQVKGTTSADDNYYRISREFLDGYKAERGTAFFVVKVNENFSKVFYNLLQSDEIDKLLQQTTKTIKIDLKEAPANPLDFEKEIFVFANKRNMEKIENSSPNEIHVLVDEFEDIRGHIDEIEDTKIRYDLESLLDSIKNLNIDGTVGWRDKFIYYSQKALDLATKNINGQDFVYLQFNLGKYLKEQKQYHLAEKQYVESSKKYRKNVEELATTTNIYNLAIAMNNMGNLHHDLNRFDEAEREFKKALKIFMELADYNHDAYIGDLAMTLNNLASLHDDLYRYDEAEWEYKTALEIRRMQAKTNRNAYIESVGQILNNMATLHLNLNRYAEADKEYLEALNIFRELAKTNRNAYIGGVAQILNNLGGLHFKLNRFDETEAEFEEALEIRYELAKTNRNAYIGDVAQTLNNLAILCQISFRYDAAESNFLKALEIYQELAETNHGAYIVLMAQTLNNLALLHKDLTRYEDAEKEHKKALEINLELAKTNRDAYIGEVAKTLEDIAKLQIAKDCKDEAIKAAEGALGIYKELAETYPHTWNQYVEKTLRLLESIKETKSPSLLSRFIAFFSNKRS